MKTIIMMPSNSAMTRLNFEIFRRSVAKPVGPVLAASFFFFLLFLEATVHSFLFPLPVLRPPAPGSKSFHSVQMIQKDYRPFGEIFPPPSRRHRPMPTAYRTGRRPCLFRSLPEQTLLPVLFALHIQQAVAHFPQLLLQLRPRNIALRNDGALPGAVGGLHFFYLKILPNQVVHVAFAHATLHSVNMCRNLTHLRISFFYRKNIIVMQNSPTRLPGNLFTCYFFGWHPPPQPCPPWEHMEQVEQSKPQDLCPAFFSLIRYRITTAARAKITRQITISIPFKAFPPFLSYRKKPITIRMAITIRMPIPASTITSTPFNAISPFSIIT